MPHKTHIAGASRLALIALAALGIAGCVGAPREPEPAPPPAPVELPPPIELPALTAPAFAAPQTRVIRRAPRPHEIVVLFPPNAPAYAEIAVELEKRLPNERYRVLQVPLDAAVPSALADLRISSGAVAVAIGLEAVAAARARLPLAPLVFCQVFNYQDLLGAERTWGVQSVPPLGLQLESWKTVDPSLRRIGLIVSEAQAGLADDAAEAATAAGAEVTAAVSSSDRETLYLFKRLAPELDGLWLFPDNRILSPGVLQELLTYAVTHRISVLALNDGLLDWGALLSASSTAADVALTVRRVIERVVAGRTELLAPLTPLSEAEFQVNRSVASQLGIPVGPESRWVLREPD
jgi:ABC transporter substrate binding protein